MYYMQNPYFDLTVPVFIKNLENAKHILDKSFAHSKSVGMSESDFLDARLAPDMFPLVKQVQLITDHAKGAPARLCGIEPLSIEDNETTVAQLMARIDSVIAHLKTFKPEQFTNSATQEIVVKYFPGKHFHGADYFVEYALPNFFFHLSMLYAIGRMMGVPLGKADFVGSLTLQDSVN
jgi:uncharacterized protein